MEEKNNCSSKLVMKLSCCMDSDGVKDQVNEAIVIYPSAKIEDGEPVL